MRYLTVLLIAFISSPLFSQSTPLTEVKENLSDYMSVITDSAPSGLTDVDMSHIMTLDLSGFNLLAAEITEVELEEILASLDGVSEVDISDNMIVDLLVNPKTVNKTDLIVSLFFESGLRF